MELVPVCAWCPEVEIPAGKLATHTICREHLLEKFPKMAPKVLARQQVKTQIELANPFLVNQTF
ncbi:hypothetical protein [Geopsychrobacter electrodiphilus]|uniref:hypothetical protein n=1 Tax=Geopsychrobacter electrodiphilus TaxID=225196 RepID=UPI00037AA372|nr:hypothetical protein [Geopsychrobacter electrodiphilus]